MHALAAMTRCAAATRSDATLPVPCRASTARWATAWPRRLSPVSTQRDSWFRPKVSFVVACPTGAAARTPQTITREKLLVTLQRRAAGLAETLGCALLQYPSRPFPKGFYDAATSAALTTTWTKRLRGRTGGAPGGSGLRTMNYLLCTESLRYLAQWLERISSGV